MATKIVEFHHDPSNGGFYTTALFWECECEEVYIHPLQRCECCACGVQQEDAPDARLLEVIRHASEFNLDQHLVDAAFRLAAAEQAEKDVELIPFTEATGTPTA